MNDELSQLSLSISFRLQALLRRIVRLERGELLPVLLVSSSLKQDSKVNFLIFEEELGDSNPDNDKANA
jgi:hypothetical protein